MFPGVSVAALQVDAMDGRMDGTYFGLPIAGAGGYGGMGMGPARPPMMFPSPAMQVDAMDGRIDGTYFGAPIMGGPGPVW